MRSRDKKGNLFSKVPRIHGTSEERSVVFRWPESRVFDHGVQHR